MNAYPDHGINDPDISLGEGQQLPSAEAVMAATLALMTGHAQACCDKRRWAMLTKTIANLRLLAQHPEVSSGFKSVADQLHAMWLRLREQWQHPAPDNGAQAHSAHSSALPFANAPQAKFNQLSARCHAASETLQ